MPSIMYAPFVPPGQICPLGAQLWVTVGWEWVLCGLDWFVRSIPCVLDQTGIWRVFRPVLALCLPGPMHNRLWCTGCSRGQHRLFCLFVLHWFFCRIRPDGLAFGPAGMGEPFVFMIVSPVCWYKIDINVNVLILCLISICGYSTWLDITFPQYDNKIR